MPAVEEAEGDAPEPAQRTRRSPALAVLYGFVAAVVVAIPTWWVATTEHNFAMPEPVTSDGEEVVFAWRVLMSMATAVAMVVVILLVVAVVSGARRRHASQTKGSVPLELTYTAVPIVLVAVIFGLSLWVDAQIEDRTADEDLVVGVDAFRWGWRFSYPNGAEVVGGSRQGTEPVLVLPVDRTITFRLASDDVIHSFWVPAFTRKLDVVPGQDNQLRVHPNVTGEYRGHCAEYCGLDHARMNFAVEVVSQDEFDAFLEEADR